MTKTVQYMGYNVIIDDDDDLIQPENQEELIAILEKSVLVNFRMTPNDDGTFTYTFDYKILRSEIETHD